MPEEQLVIAFHNNTIYSFERAGSHSASSFGGPMLIEFTGVSRPEPLHLIARLAGLHLPALGQPYLLWGMPFVFGMRYAGCEMTYRVIDTHKIEILALKPAQPSDNCPYADFPSMLPFVPLRLIDVPRRVAYRDFVGFFPNLPNRQPAELVIAVPAPATIGLSFWGNADRKGTTIIFECNLDQGIINTYAVTA